MDNTNSRYTKPQKEHLCFQGLRNHNAFLGCLPPQTKTALIQESGWLWSGALTCGTSRGGCGSREEEGSGEKDRGREVARDGGRGCGCQITPLIFVLRPAFSQAHDTLSLCCVICLQGWLLSDKADQGSKLSLSALL